VSISLIYANELNEMLSVARGGNSQNFPMKFQWALCYRHSPTYDHTYDHNTISKDG